MKSLDLPLTARTSRLWVMVTLIGAAISAILLFQLPDLWSNRLQFGLAYFFCAIAGGGILFLSQKKPDLVVSTDGIYTSYWGITLVYWDDIETVFIQSNLTDQWICLSLTHPEKYLARCGPVARAVSLKNKSIGFGDLTIKPSAMGLEASGLLQLIQGQITLSRSLSKPAPSSVRYQMPMD